MSWFTFFYFPLLTNAHYSHTQYCTDSIYSYKAIKEPADSYIKSFACGVFCMVHPLNVLCPSRA